MKSKEKLWVLTKEGLTHEVKKDHEGPKAQKEGKIKKKVKKKKKKTQTQATSGISNIQEVDPSRESLEDSKKDVDNLEDPKEDMGNPKDSLGTSHSYVFLK